MDVIIRNQDIKKFETTCFGLTLAIFRFHLEKSFVIFCYTIMQNRIGVEHSSLTCLVKYGLFYRREKTYYYLDPLYLHMWGSLCRGVVLR